MIEELQKIKSQEEAVVNLLLETLDDYRTRIVLECQRRFPDIDYSFMDEVELVPPNKDDKGVKSG